MNEIRQIPLNKIRPSPFNPRRKFSGPKFNEFTANIAAVGVLQPILVRPVAVDEYEIVFGGRRYAASCRIADKNGGIEAAAIPAQVRDMDDDTALDLMTVENLHRQDLTPLEEAANFKLYVDKFGETAIADLAERVNLHPVYIRRRLAYLRLPKAALNAWDQGKLQTGHLQQLCRLKNKKQILGYVEEILERLTDPGWQGPMGVSELRREIDSESPPLKWARFDMESAGCPGCHFNSDVQKKLFDFDAPEKTKCLNPVCFKQNQNNHYLSRWKKLSFYKRYHTNGFRFDRDIDHGEFQLFYGMTPSDECRQCEEFITILNLDGTALYEIACRGPADCYERIRKAADQKKKKQKSAPAPDAAAGEVDPDQPRVAWHGEHFREAFFQQRIPEVYADQEADSEEVARMAILAMIESNWELKARFLATSGIGKCELDEEDDGEPAYKYCGHVPDHEVFNALCDMDLGALRHWQKFCAEEVIMDSAKVSAQARLKVAVHLGIDISEEWAITQEYLEKKTKSEMLHFGETLGIFSDPRAESFIFEVLGKKRGASPKSLKVGELRRVFLESGVELKGKVPTEVLPKLIDVF